jgi:hypothetical protein
VADQPKKKNPNAVSRNDTRPNGKANKTAPDAFFGHNRAYRGSHTRKSPQTPLQKVLMGKGTYRGIGKRVDGTDPKPWRLATAVPQPYDKAQVEENKRLYPHLFED